MRACHARRLGSASCVGDVNDGATVYAPRAMRASHGMYGLRTACAEDVMYMSYAAHGYGYHVLGRPCAVCHVLYHA